MRAALHMFLMFCVAWCALGVGEPVGAAPAGDRQHLVTGSPLLDDAAHGDRADPDGQVHHHHCPIASDIAPGHLADRVGPARHAPVPRQPEPLASLTRAPPLQPPATA